MPYYGTALAQYADLPNMLSASAALQPEASALVTIDKQWTFAELALAIDHLAAQFVAMGLEPGARAASLVPNRCELLIHYLACMRAGLVATPLNYRYTSTEIDYALSVSGASMLLAHAERSEDIGNSKLVGKLQHGLLSFAGELIGASAMEDLLGSERPDVTLPPGDADAPALLFFTSGSTGAPKGVTHSVRSFGSIAASIAVARSFTHEDTVLPGGSIAHVGALSVALGGLYAGAKVALPEGLASGDMVQLMRHHPPTVLVTLPSSLIALERDHGARAEDFQALRLCMTGGDSMPASASDEFKSLTGLAIKDIYGLTEATNCLSDFSADESKAGSTGSVSPGYKVSLRNADGEEVAADTDGLLWIGGDPVMLGYWGDPEATAAAMDDGWFNSGDVMRVDDDGFFWFRGRKKQIIVHDGSNIAPQDIEAVLMAHPAIGMAGVVGVHDEVHGENVWAYVTEKEDATPVSHADLIAFARERVGYKAPEVIIKLNDMPLNATGKVDREALKAMATERSHTGD